MQFDFYCHMQGSVNLDKGAEKLPSFPQIMRLRHDESTHYFIAVEKKVLLESASIEGSVLDLIGAYYSVDIVYPRQLYPLLIFIQHIILNIFDQQRVPTNFTILCTSLDKL